MTDLILWSYDASPFTQKALGMLGVKGLDWRWVETPMMPPKDDLLALTGGYRGTPVLQVGADVYVDSQLIARELERRFPQPTLFPAGGGLELALVRWSDAFFRSGLRIILGLTLAQWPAEFRRDRQQLFPDIDFDTVGEDLGHASSQFRAHAALLEAQLADGRAYLAGPSPGLADIQAWPFLWMARSSMGALAGELLDDLGALGRWEARMRALGEGRRQPLPAAEALAGARAATPAAAVQVDVRDPQALRAGQAVEVAPDDTRRGAVRGEVVVATAGEIALRRQHEAVGEVVIHFPRLGYRVTPLA